MTQPIDVDAELRKLRQALERILAECRPEAAAEICPCLACTRQTHAWMIAGEVLGGEPEVQP